MVKKISLPIKNKRYEKLTEIKKPEILGAGLAIAEIIKTERHIHKKTTAYYFVISGAGLIEVGKKKIKVKKNDLIEIKPKTVHRAYALKKPFVVLFITKPAFQKKDYFKIETK